MLFLHLCFSSGPCRKALKFSQLHARASESGISDEQLNKAIDLGPEDGHDELVDLVLIAEENVGLDRLYDQTVSTLYQMAQDAVRPHMHLFFLTVL